MTGSTDVEPLVFDCEGARLVGLLHRAATAAGDVGVLVVVGGPQYRVGSHRQFVLMAREFARAGYPVLRFDYRGMGDSEGEYRGFEHVQADIRAGVDALLHADERLRGVVLWGLCDGASAALMYAHGDARVVGVVIANPWAHTPQAAADALVREHYSRRILQPELWAKLLSGRLNVLRSARELLAVIRDRRAGRSARADDDYVARMRDGCRALERPLLAIESGRDLTMAEFAGVRDRDPAWTAAFRRPWVERAALPSADHTFSERAALDEMTRRCLDWLARNVTRSGAGSESCR